MTNQATEQLQPDGVAKRQPRAPWLLGAIGVLLALSAGVLQVLGIVQASNLNWERGALLAWAAIGVSVVAFVVGVIAVILNRGRRWGVAAVVGGVLANPFILAQLLGAFT